MKKYVKPMLGSDEIIDLYDILFEMIQELHRLGAGTDWARERVRQLENICFTEK